MLWVRKHWGGQDRLLVGKVWSKEGPAQIVVQAFERFLEGGGGFGPELFGKL